MSEHHNVGNNYAQGNRGGSSAPKNKNGERWGFFSKIFPESDEIREIVRSICDKDSLDILWENIIIQYTAIARAQKIMWVKNQDDLTKLWNGPDTCEIQTAWDKHANFMAAQSKAMSVLTVMITRYEDMLRRGLVDEEQKLRIDKLKAEIKKLNFGSDEDGKVQIVDDIK